MTRGKNKQQESIIVIDKDRLDVEWLAQPDLYYEQAKSLALASKDVDEAKAELEVVKAELAQDIRTNPSNYDLEKITESVVASTILLQSEHADALQTFIDAKYKQDLHKAIVSALDHRKKALENLVHLHGQNYFSSPHDPTGEMEGVQKDQTRRRGRRTK